MNYAVKEITEGAEYEFRVLAINNSGSGDPSPPSAMVCAKNPNSKWLTSCFRAYRLFIHSWLLAFCISCFAHFHPVRPRFKEPEDFIVVRAGNSARVNICYEVSIEADLYYWAISLWLWIKTLSEQVTSTVQILLPYSSHVMSWVTILL